MAGKVHTDSEALYAVRSAITKFAGSFQEAQGGFSQCFEQMNYQIDDYQRRLRAAIEECFEEKRSLEREIEDCEEKKAEAERKKEANKSGSTDSFVCRNNACEARMMLKVYGDTTTCRSCGGTMHRVYTGGEYNRYNSEAYQLENRIKELRKRVDALETKIRQFEEVDDDIAKRCGILQSQQISIMSLLTFGSGEDPETAIAFIDKALASLGDYQAVTMDAESTEKKTDLASENGSESKEAFFHDPNAERTESTNQEAVQLRQMGINRVYIDSCHETNRVALVMAVKKMFEKHPELRGQVSEISCHKMRKGTYAAYGPTEYGMNFGGVLNINSDYFSDPKLDADISEKSRMGWFVPNGSVESVIEHELGHGMHLELCSRSCGVQNGSMPDAQSYNRVVRQYMDDCHADVIVENACRSLGIEFDSWDFSRQLSRYGGSNYGEAIAEAVAEVESNLEPRPLARAIYNGLMNYDAA